MQDVVINGSRASFFNEKLISSISDKMTVRMLSRCGAFVRQTAKTSIRYGKDHAKPGRPPKAKRLNSFSRTTTNKKTGKTTKRATSPLRELLFFAYDKEQKSVVIGPMQFKQSRTRGWKPPAVLETGGTVSERTKRGIRRLRFRGNPYMGPALRKEQPKFAPLFAGQFRK